MTEPIFTKRLVMALMDRAASMALDKCADDLERWSNYELKVAKGMPDEGEWLIKATAHQQAIRFMRDCAQEFRKPKPQPEVQGRLDFSDGNL